MDRNSNVIFTDDIHHLLCISETVNGIVVYN